MEKFKIVLRKTLSLIKEVLQMDSFLEKGQLVLTHIIKEAQMATVMVIVIVSVIAIVIATALPMEIATLTVIPMETLISILILTSIQTQI